MRPFITSDSMTSFGFQGQTQGLPGQKSAESRAIYYALIYLIATAKHPIWSPCCKAMERIMVQQDEYKALRGFLSQWLSLTLKFYDLLGQLLVGYLEECLDEFP